MVDQLARSPGDAPAQFRCAFVHCPDSGYADTQNYGAQFMPVWAYTLAAHLPERPDLKLSLWDTRFDDLDDVEEADVFLFSGINQDFSMLESVHKALKARFPQAFYILGGPIAWSFDQAGDVEKLGFFDLVFVGDGEGKIQSLVDSIRAGETLPPYIRNTDRFDVNSAKPLFRPLLSETVHRYYGAVVEVARGCPFLCEFCDIRVLPDNNRSHNKPVELIVGELDYMSSLGVNQVLLACDNFIGDPKWAEAVVDAILNWQDTSGRQLSLYTWLTINLSRYPRLMEKMRRAGFDMLFIGVESFNKNSLLETAKVQNTRGRLVETLQTIQSFGFIVVAGLIFGFDSDTEDSFEQTLSGIEDAGLLSGDPSLLTALPGTPLYERLARASRLRQGQYGLGRYKYRTNIKYLLSRDLLVSGYLRFVHSYNRGDFQLRRLQRYFETVANGGNYIPLEGHGYGNIFHFMRMVARNRRAQWQLAVRLARFMRRPTNVLYLAVAVANVIWRYRQVKGRGGAFQFWLFAWTNSLLKYDQLSPRDFDIDDVGGAFDLTHLRPALATGGSRRPAIGEKVAAQRRYTDRALEELFQTRAKSKPAVAVSERED